MRLWVLPANFLRISNASFSLFALPIISLLSSTIVSAAMMTASFFFPNNFSFASKAFALANSLANLIGLVYLVLNFSSSMSVANISNGIFERFKISLRSIDFEAKIMFFKIKAIEEEF